MLMYQAVQAFESGDWASLIPSAMSLVGCLLGGAAGAFLGPLGMVGGGMLGSELGTWAGNKLIGGAKGLAGYSGPALIGEAGGEVHITRSALRSGVGVGGRAASALGGIGVPGFY